MRSFFALAMALFVTDLVLSRANGRPSFEIDAEAAALLEARQVELLGRELTDTEREAAVAAFVDETLLIKEAFRRGYDRGDPQIRSALIERMRQTLAGFPPAATDDEARAYFDAHRERYRAPETIAFDHVFAYHGAEPEGLLEALRSGHEPSEMDLDPALTSARRLESVTRTDLSASLGRELAAAVFELSPGEWYGPLRSRLGLHYVRVRGRTPARERAYEEASWMAAQDWSDERYLEALEQHLPAIRERYRVVIEHAP